MTGPDILYVASFGFASRMLLQSELLPELASRGLRVAILSPSAGESHFRELCERRGARPIAAPKVAGRLLGEYGEGRRYLFEDFEHNASLRAKHVRETQPTTRLPFRLRAAVGKVVNSGLLAAPSVMRALGSIERRLLRSSVLQRLLRELKPRLVAVTYPVTWLDALTVIEAQRLGIPTVGQLLSWDNITCKGRFAAIPIASFRGGPS